jgi:D-alanine-D-alanine ligase-like ATP-grasp enzyme
MARVLLLAKTTGYQTRAFGEAAERLGVELVFATDRCNVLEDPWQDHAIAVRFHEETASTATILEAARTAPLDGVLAVGDRPTVLAALVQEGLGLPGHPAAAATIARNKLNTRERFRDRGLPVPWFRPVSIAIDPLELAPSVEFPCVIKPLGLSGSRGVMRVNDGVEFVAAFRRLRDLLQTPDLRADPIEGGESVLLEQFIEGREFALEGLMNHGALHTLAIFDKPDPLSGPFFEETIYVTPSVAPIETQRALSEAVERASRALGLRHGPIHAECRLHPSAPSTSSGQEQVFVLEVAARPIGGLCARALRFEKKAGEDPSPSISFEELLLRHALGESSESWKRERAASGVMMIPIPRRGIFRGVEGVEQARGVPLVEDVRITAKPDQLLVPLPEGASYLGFIFARGETAAAVEGALRAAHVRLEFSIDQEVRVVQSAHG